METRRKRGKSDNASSTSDKKPWGKSPYHSKQRKLQQQQRPKHSSNRKRVITFDEDERKSFLSGFQKRKQERKQRAKERIDEQVREEVKRIKARRDEKLKKIFTDTSLQKELDQHAEYALQYDLPEQTVEIKGFDIGNITNSLGLSMGVNKPKYPTDKESDDVDEEKIDSKEEENEEEVNDDEKTEESISNSKNICKDMKKIKKSSSKELNKSKIMKTKQRLNSKKKLNRKRYRKESSKRK